MAKNQKFYTVTGMKQAGMWVESVNYPGKSFTTKKVIEHATH